MSQYRRYYQSGGYYFFTLVTYQRYPIFSDPEKVEQLKFAINKVKKDRKFAHEILCGGRPQAQKPPFCPICDRDGESRFDCRARQRNS